jgi:CBS domain-containing protein
MAMGRGTTAAGKTTAVRGKTTTVADIMTRNVVTLLEEDNLLSVGATLARFRFHHLPVVDGRKLVGMLSQRDVLRLTVAGVDRSAAAQAREARFLESTFVRDIMRTDVVTARSDESVRAAATRMLEHRFGALPVVDGLGNLVGIVTENDVVRTAAKEL